MRHIVTTLAAVGFALVAQALPIVSSDPSNVQLNAWNSNLAAAKSKAKALNRPTLMVMLDTVNCGYSKSWVSNIADASAWQSFIAANPLALVFADKTKLSSSTWSGYIRPYGDSSGYFYYPTVVLFRPDGSVADQFVARGSLGMSPGFYTRVKKTTDQYPKTGTPPGTPTPGVVGFSQPSLTVSEGATSVSVTVTRQGGTSGAQTFSYATAAGTALDGVNYTGTAGTLAWADGNAAAKTVTVKLLNDNTWTSPTARTFTIRLTRTSGTAALGTAALTVTINEVTAVSTAPAFTAPTPGAGATVSAVLNGAVSIQTRATGSTPIAYSATGLPAGVSINAGTGLISGTPTGAGSSTVTVKASNSKGTATTSFTLRVVAQSSIAAGSYRGFFYEPGQQTVRGTLLLSASASGALKAQAVLDGVSYTFTGTRQAGAASAAELQSKYSDDILGIQVDSLGILTGVLNDAALLGRLVDPSGAGKFAGYYTSILGAAAVAPVSGEIDNQPEGSGYVTFTVNSRCSVSYKGVLADGTRFSGSSAIVIYSGAELAELGYTEVADDQAYACFPLYKTLYSRRGAVAAQIWIGGQDSPLPEDNRVFVAGSEWVYPGASAKLQDDGFVASFDDGSFKEIGAAFVKTESLSEAFDGASLQVDCGAVPVQASGASIGLPSGNPLKASLTASRTTGLFAGRFLYSPDSGASPYTVKYAGVLVPSLDIGAGYFLAPDKSIDGYNVKRSKPVVIAP